MIRVALCTHYFAAHRGGVEIAALNLARTLASSTDVEFHWLAANCDIPPEEGSGLRTRPLAAWNTIERLTGLPYPVPTPRSFAEITEEVRSADLVHIHDFMYPANLAAAHAARRFSKPIVLTQHIGAIPYESATLRTIQAGMNRIVGSPMLARADQVVFISEAVRDYFQRFVRFARPPEHWPNGVDTEMFSPVDPARQAALRAGLGAPADRPLVAFVGRFVARKGLALLERVCALTPEITWIFAGWGTIDPQRWNLPNVSVVRDRSGATLAPLYQAADLLVLPSRGEGFPLVIQEAMACGTPALTSDETLAGAPRASAQVFAERLATSDVAALWARRVRDSLALLRAEPERRQAVREFACREWGWERCASLYLQLYRRLMG